MDDRPRGSNGFRQPPAWLRLLHAGALDRAARAALGGRPIVLLYHGVDHTDHDGKFTTLQNFRRDLDHLQEHFRVVPLADIEAWLTRGAPLPRSSLAITFDDGHRNLCETAFPELARRGLPATVFVCSMAVSDPRAVIWLDDVECRILHTPELPPRLAVGDRVFQGGGDRRRLVREVKRWLKGLPYAAKEQAVGVLLEALHVDTSRHEPIRLMTGGQLAGLRGMGIDVGGHTATHEILARLDTETQRRQLRDCFGVLSDCLGHAPAHFSYPNGQREDIGAQTPGLVREAGFRLAFTTIGGLVRRGTPQFLLPRVSAGFFGMYDPGAWAPALHLRVAVTGLR